MVRPCPKCGENKWIIWEDSTNATCKKCGTFLFSVEEYSERVISGKKLTKKEISNKR